MSAAPSMAATIVAPVQVLDHLFRRGHVLQVEPFKLIHRCPGVLGKRVDVHLAVRGSQARLQRVVAQGIGRQLLLIIDQIGLGEDVVEDAPGGINRRRSVGVFRQPDEGVRIGTFLAERVQHPLIERHADRHGDAGPLAGLAPMDGHFQMGWLAAHLDVLVPQAEQFALGGA